MSDSRFLAVCVDCGQPYEATLTSDQTLHLGGGKKACTCGGEHFELIGDGVPDDVRPMD